MEKIQDVSRGLLNQARRNRRLVDVLLLRHLNRVAIDCSLAMPFAQFYTRYLYESIKNPTPNGKRVRLTHATVKDLRYWRELKNDLPNAALHLKTLLWLYNPTRRPQSAKGVRWDPIYHRVTRNVGISEVAGSYSSRQSDHFVGTSSSYRQT